MAWPRVIRPVGDDNEDFFDNAGAWGIGCIQAVSDGPARGTVGKKQPIGFVHFPDRDPPKMRRSRAARSRGNRRR